VTRARWLVSVVALVLFAAYSLYVVVVAVSAGKGHGALFWFSIGLIVVLAAAALWLSRRLYRRKVSRPST
jgi:hypothetical protein